MLYEEDEDIHPKKPKLSAKKAQKKGILDKSISTESQGISARIASVYGGSASVLINGAIFPTQAPASIMMQLAVGDEVQVDTSSQPARVLNIQPRRNELTRTRGESGSRHRKQSHLIATNIDTAIIVATAANPDFDPELVDRYIIISRTANIEPVICVNKADLTDARHPVLDWYRHHGLKVIETSPKTNVGLDNLRQTLKGKTAILLGKSGAGKSSLINALIPNANIKTKELSENAQQGQHTTTRSDIHTWSPDSYVIDTPGIRMLDISHVDSDDIALGFPDILALAAHCHFADCTHQQEPDCAVQKALEGQELPTYRWDSYQKITTER